MADRANIMTHFCPDCQLRSALDNSDPTSDTVYMYSTYAKLRKMPAARRPGPGCGP